MALPQFSNGVSYNRGDLRQVFGKNGVASQTVTGPRIISPNSTLAGTRTGSVVLLVCAFALIANHFGRPFEQVLVGFHIPAVICWISIVAALLLGALRQFTHRIGLALVAYTGWMAAAVPFSAWRGGSARYLAAHVTLNVVLFLVVAAAARQFSDVRKLVLVTAGGCIVYLLIGGRIVGGRMAGEGTWGNSDDVALMAGFALPLWLFAATRFGPVFLRLPMALAGGLFLLRSLVLSGTRAGLLALVFATCIYFLRSSGLTRFLMVLALPLLGALFLLVIPAQLLNRYDTILDSFDSETVAAMRGRSEAMASAADRKELLMDAIRMTLQHPLLGVGPGEFGEYRYSHFVGDNGGPRRWFPSHNTYLQISSETGIPGVLCYVIFLAMIYKTILLIRAHGKAASHPDAKEMGSLAAAMELSLGYFAFCALLMTCDKHPHIFALAGIAVCAERVALLHRVSSPATQPVVPEPVSRYVAAGRSV